jgi:hypothetical protein
LTEERRLRDLFEGEDALTVTESSTTTRLRETDDERRSRLRREEWDVIAGHAFRALVAIVYVSAIVFCAVYVTDERLGDWARPALLTLVSALGGFVLGRQSKVG